jgi:hypothetical protein
MERNLKEVFHEAVQLPERDRATLAGLLIEKRSSAQLLKLALSLGKRGSGITNAVR